MEEDKFLPRGNQEEEEEEDLAYSSSVLALEHMLRNAMQDVVISVYGGHVHGGFVYIHEYENNQLSISMNMNSSIQC
jgi:hypothetical protein